MAFKSSSSLSSKLRWYRPRIPAFLKISKNVICKTDLSGHLLLGSVKEHETWQSLHPLEFRSPAPSILNEIKYSNSVKIIFWSSSKTSKNRLFIINTIEELWDFPRSSYFAVLQQIGVPEIPGTGKIGAASLANRKYYGPSRQALIQKAWIKRNELDNHCDLQRAVASSTPSQEREFTNSVQAHKPKSTFWQLLFIIWASEEMIQITLLVIN